MFSGYYSDPSERSGVGYYPSSMTAFLTGDGVATGSYLGNKYVPLNAATNEEEEVLELRPSKTVAKKESANEVTEPTVEQTTLEELEATTVKSKGVLKKKKPQLAPAEDEENDEDSYWPFRSGRYNTFFPIIFGGYPGSKGRSGEEGGFPGAATAIANSFSTGKGGVASSHATAFGDPSLSALFRNGRFNIRKTDKKDTDD